MEEHGGFVVHPNGGQRAGQIMKSSGFSLAKDALLLLVIARSELLVAATACSPRRDLLLAVVIAASEEV